MRPRNPRAFIGIAVVALAMVGGVAVVVLSPPRGPAPPPPAPKFPQPPESHPVIPSAEEPSAHPPQAFCEARDIAMVSAQLRSAHRRALGAAKAADKNGAPPTCHAAESARDLSTMLDALTKRTGGCVARDSELDSQWNQLDSAVLAYGRCIDCTHPRDDRLTGCQRLMELVESAEKTTR